MKIFRDSSLTSELDILDLGMVEVGATKQFDYFILNDSGFDIDELKFTTTNIEVEVINAPKEMKIDAHAKLSLEWKPTSAMKKALKTSLVVSGAEIWK